MNITLLSALIFVGVFALVVFIHEFGHFIVARLLKVDVEEFGFGFPPRILSLGREKGSLVLKSGKRVVIPGNFKMPYNWSSLRGREIHFSADEVREKLVLSSLEWTEKASEKRPNQIGFMDIKLPVPNQPEKRDESQEEATTQVKLGSKTGTIQWVDSIVEAHPGTEFTLNLLPLGGFNRFQVNENDPRSDGLSAAGPWVRLSVLLAGPIMNLLLGVAVFALLFYQMGIPDPTKIQILDIQPGSPAQLSGLKPDDIILTANGVPITDTTQLHDIIYSNLDKPVVFTLQRGSQTLTITATPLSSRAQAVGALGISMGPAFVRSGSVIESVKYGGLFVYYQAKALVLLPAQMIRGQVSSQDGRFIGLKGIYDLFGQAVSQDIQSREPASTGASGPSTAGTQAPSFLTLQLIATLTISLGVFNLFPFPGLDGGRIIFVLPELIIRRRVPPQFENAVNALGMIALLIFMVYINVMDFVNPAVINLPK